MTTATTTLKDILSETRAFLKSNRKSLAIISALPAAILLAMIIFNGINQNTYDELTRNLLIIKSISLIIYFLIFVNIINYYYGQEKSVSPFSAFKISKRHGTFLVRFIISILFYFFAKEAIFIVLGLLPNVISAASGAGVFIQSLASILTLLAVAFVWAYMTPSLFVDLVDENARAGYDPIDSKIDQKGTFVWIWFIFFVANELIRLVLKLVVFTEIKFGDGVTASLISETVLQYFLVIFLATALAVANRRIILDSLQE